MTWNHLENLPIVSTRALFWIFWVNPWDFLLFFWPLFNQDELCYRDLQPPPLNLGHPTCISKFQTRGSSYYVKCLHVVFLDFLVFFALAFKAYEVLIRLILEGFAKWCLKMDMASFGQVITKDKLFVFFPTNNYNKQTSTHCAWSMCKHSQSSPKFAILYEPKMVDHLAILSMYPKPSSSFNFLS